MRLHEITLTPAKIVLSIGLELAVVLGGSTMADAEPGRESEEDWEPSGWHRGTLEITSDFWIFVYDDGLCFLMGDVFGEYKIVCVPMKDLDLKPGSGPVDWPEPGGDDGPSEDPPGGGSDPGGSSPTDGTPAPVDPPETSPPMS